jgi:hypothetical protein
MSHKDNMDLRNTGDGGWFYAEHELFSVFVPLIGPDGGMVYMAMCRLIPLAAVDPDRPVTVRSVSAESGVSKSTTQRKMAAIVALGMVEEMRHSNRRPSTYKLVSLRRLSMLGREELVRRLGVPEGDTEMSGTRPSLVLDRVAAAAQAVSTDGDASKAELGEVSREPTAPEGSGASGVPRWDTEALERKSAPADMPVSQKTASVSQKQASVSQNARRLKEEEKEKELNPPYPPNGRVNEISPVAQRRWDEFRTMLKSELHSIPGNVARKFPTLKPDQNDYETCFDQWWLLGWMVGPDGLHLITFANDEDATEAGIAKYQSRLVRLARKYFHLEPSLAVRFTVQRPEAQ